MSFDQFVETYGDHLMGVVSVIGFIALLVVNL